MIDDIGVVVKDNFLTNEEISLLLDFCKTSSAWQDGDITKTGKDFWSGRTIALVNCPKEISKKVVEIKDRIESLMKESYAVQAYCDQIAFMRWFDGMEQGLHSDDMRGNKNGEDFSWFFHRELSSIIYLNDDFEGGLTYYHNFPELAVKPIPGRIVIHPGSVKFLHGVSKVKGNTRYTIASFWGTDKNYDEKHYDQFR